MMKKLKAIIPLICIISGAAHGYDELLKDTNKYTESGRKLIYLKASAGAALLNETKDTASSLKMKSKLVPYFAVGVGTYFMDNTRVDLTFERAANLTLKKSGSASLNDSMSSNIGQLIFNDINNQAANAFSTSNLAQLGFTATGIPVVQSILNDALTLFKNNASAANFNDLILQAANNRATQNGTSAAAARTNAQVIVQRISRLNNSSNIQDFYSLLTQDFSSMSISTKVNHKTDINAFMVNGAVDLYEFNRVKFFAGVGLGVAQLKEKISITSNLNLNGTNSLIIDESISTKKASNFAYSFTAGTSAKVTDKVTFELAYAWKDYGKTKSVKIQGVEVGKTPYRSHTLTAGVRVDI
jgi:opacity protein-like surface antigen